MEVLPHVELATIAVTTEAPPVGTATTGCKLGAPHTEMLLNLFIGGSDEVDAFHLP